MGPKSSKSKESREKQNSYALGRNMFEFLHVIGRGGFGKVWKVKEKKSKISFALKEMMKAKIIDKRSERSIKYERELLEKVRHPFIVNMQYAFQDTEHLYLVLDLLNGGDLRYQLSRQRRFNEEQTKFFVACMVQALEFVHDNKIIHRDLKPENFVLEESGYLRLTDFGIAKLIKPDNHKETSGTPGYMAPEVMCSHNHGIAVDFFALGVFTYEFMMGRRPYLGRSRREIKEQILSKQAMIKQIDVPLGWSLEAADFANKLLIRKDYKRLGYKGAIELKCHPWFENFPWEDLNSKRLEPPFKPKIGDNFDKKYCEAPDKTDKETKLRYEKILKDENLLMSAFRDFLPYGEVKDRNLSKKALVEKRKSSLKIPLRSRGSNKSIKKVVRSTSTNIQPSYIKHNRQLGSIQGSTGTTLGTRKSNRSSNSYGNNFNMHP